MPPAEGQQQAAQQQFSWSSLIFRAALIYLAFSYFSPFKTTNVEETVITTETGIQQEGNDILINAPPIEGGDAKDINTKPTKQTHYPIYSKQQQLHMQVFYLEESYEAKLLWHKTIVLSSFAEDQYETIITEIPLDNHLLNNGSATITTVFSKNQLSWDQITEGMRIKSKDLFWKSYPLIHYKLQQKFVEKQNLITGEYTKPDLTKEAETEGGERKIVSFWKPNVTISVVDEFSKYSQGSIPEQLKKHFVFTSDNFGYFPVVYYNDFWVLSEMLMPINDTLTKLPLTISYEPLSQVKFMFYEQFHTSLEMQKQFGSTDKDIDDLKLMLFETNPYLLGLTVAVTLLHTVFDVLAFKNDITYWKNKKSMVGMSVRTIFVNTFCQLISFLYLFDNDTSFVILCSVGIGILIEFWKITKAVDVSIDYTYGFPLLKFKDKSSYADNPTKKYDKLAFKYLSFVLFPLVIGYSIYSLYYETHKSWYSWILASLVGCVYTFGFIMMTPQLFINYKLKSVAHLPWRTFTYKALNTFIDDLFAFIIRMPTLHRLSCFRDDIVFLIFVLQWYMYGSDKRRNEYGEFIEDPVVEEKKEEEKKAETGAKKAEEKKEKNSEPETGAKKRKDTKKEKNSEPVENQPEKKGKKSAGSKKTN